MKRLVLPGAMLAILVACETNEAPTVVDTPTPPVETAGSPVTTGTPEVPPVPETPAAPEAPPAPEAPSATETPEAPEPPEAPAPASEVARSIETDWAHMPQSDAWTALAAGSIDAIGSPLLKTVPSDIDAFCPAYERLDDTGRRAFWVGLLSAMARFESGFDPSVSFDERAHCPSCDWALTRDGRHVISRGLLQLSQESANAYRGCPVSIADEEKLHEPALNLRCGVAIMSRLVSRDGVISRKDGQWKGGSAYWSVLRPGKLEAIQAYTSTTENCGG